MPHPKCAAPGCRTSALTRSLDARPGRRRYDYRTTGAGPNTTAKPVNMLALTSAGTPPFDSGECLPAQKGANGQLFRPTVAIGAGGGPSDAWLSRACPRQRAITYGRLPAAVPGLSHGCTAGEPDPHKLVRPDVRLSVIRPHEPRGRGKRLGSEFVRDWHGAPLAIFWIRSARREEDLTNKQVKLLRIGKKFNVSQCLILAS